MSYLPTIGVLLLLLGGGITAALVGLVLLVAGIRARRPGRGKAARR